MSGIGNFMQFASANAPHAHFVELFHQVERLVQHLMVHVTVAAQRALALTVGTVLGRKHGVDLHNHFWCCHAVLLCAVGIPPTIYVSIQFRSGNRGSARHSQRGGQPRTIPLWPRVSDSCRVPEQYEVCQGSGPPYCTQAGVTAATGMVVVQLLSARSALDRLIRVAAAAAPNPLSIFTTVTPAAQELSMAKRAATPPKLAP